MISGGFGWLAIVLPLAGFASYVRDTLRGRTMPNRVSWALWTAGPAIAFAGELMQHTGLRVALVTLALAAGPAAVLVASLVSPGARARARARLRRLLKPFHRAYGWIRDAPVAVGVPREVIAFIHNATNGAARKPLFAACRDGGRRQWQRIPAPSNTGRVILPPGPIPGELDPRFYGTADDVIGLHAIRDPRQPHGQSGQPQEQPPEPLVAHWQLGRLDWACAVLGAAALGALITGIVSGRPGTAVAAIALSIAADACAAVPTIAKSWTHPESETIGTYAASCAGSVIVLLTLRPWTFAGYGFPAYVAVVCTVIIALVIRRSVVWACKVLLCPHGSRHPGRHCVHHEDHPSLAEHRRA